MQAFFLQLIHALLLGYRKAALIKFRETHDDSYVFNGVQVFNDITIHNYNINEMKKKCLPVLLCLTKDIVEN